MMKRLADIAYVRSKNAGPFWVTIDVFFNDRDAFEAHRSAGNLSSETIAKVFDSPPQSVKRFEVDSLNVIKFSYPRKLPQGGVLERDMHSGQAFTRMLGLAV